MARSEGNVEDFTTMHSKIFSGILHPLSFDEALETSKIFSVAAMLNNSPLMAKRQFRAPRHTISDAGLVGGGRPGRQPGLA